MCWLSIMLGRDSILRWRRWIIWRITKRNSLVGLMPMRRKLMLLCVGCDEVGDAKLKEKERRVTKKVCLACTLVVAFEYSDSGFFQSIKTCDKMKLKLRTLDDDRELLMAMDNFGLTHEKKKGIIHEKKTIWRTVYLGDSFPYGHYFSCHVLYNGQNFADVCLSMILYSSSLALVSDISKQGLAEAMPSGFGC